MSQTSTVIQADFGGDASLPIKLRALEALLFSSPEPLEECELENQLDLTALEVATHLSSLKVLYQARGIVLEQIGTAWAFRTASDVAEHLSIERIVEKKLSRAAIETLAIIAYHQPITRAEIEEIRGVAVSRGTLDLLLELEWIQPGGRRETLGKPLTWKTTTNFLDHFNLESTTDLPGVEDLRAAGMLSKRATLNSETLGKMGEDLSDEGVLDQEDQDGADMLVSANEVADDDADEAST